MPMVLFVFSLRTPRRRANKEKKKAGHALTHAHRVSFPQLLVFLSVASMVASLAFPFIFHLLRKEETQRSGTGGKEREAMRKRRGNREPSTPAYTTTTREWGRCLTRPYKTKLCSDATDVFQALQREAAPRRREEGASALGFELGEASHDEVAESRERQIRTAFSDLLASSSSLLRSLPVRPYRSIVFRGGCRTSSGTWQYIYSTVPGWVHGQSSAETARGGRPHAPKLHGRSRGRTAPSSAAGS